MTYLFHDPVWLERIFDTFVGAFLGFTLSMYLDRRRESMRLTRKRAMYLDAIDVELEHNLDILEDVRSLCDASNHDISFYELRHLRSFFYPLLLKHVRGIRSVVFDGIMTGGFLGELGPAALTDILIHAYHSLDDLLLEVESSRNWLDQGQHEQEEHWLARRQSIVAFIGRQAAVAADLTTRARARGREMQGELKKAQ